MDFGARLRKLREDSGVSQSSLGESLSLNKSTISLYEAGKREPSQATLQKIAEYFGVSVDYLVRGSDEPAGSSLSGLLSKLPPKLRNFIIHDAEHGAMYLKVLAEAAEHGISARGLQQLLEALIAAKETADEASRRQSPPNK